MEGFRYKLRGNMGISGRKERFMGKIEKWLVVKCWSNDNIECEVDEGEALEVMERHEHDWNDVALIPLEKVLEAIVSYQRNNKNPKDPVQRNGR